jgi:hypothetical protein
MRGLPQPASPASMSALGGAAGQAPGRRPSGRHRKLGPREPRRTSPLAADDRAERASRASAATVRSAARLPQARCCHRRPPEACLAAILVAPRRLPGAESECQRTVRRRFSKGRSAAATQRRPRTPAPPRGSRRQLAVRRYARGSSTAGADRVSARVPSSRERRSGRRDAPPGSGSAPAPRRGCCTKPRLARWIRSKAGLRKWPSRSSRANCGSPRGPAQRLWHPLPRAGSTFPRRLI